MSTEKQGQMVICRDCDGLPLARRIWEESDDYVYIHDEVNFQKHAHGTEALAPVGFPVQDVFVFSEHLMPQIVAATIMWQELTPWTIGDLN